nr:uncharacterized protein LOC127298212 [Lolium perenne]XP_051184828.1 uncharacterized protein LOC127298997 [Lolium perenne]XP_051197025.1 uncharacterized protein LOC127310384 [Lolium perenne]XP_051212193.1 uncharacterized protein LOC127329791 [Lolium perenne]
MDDAQFATLKQLVDKHMPRKPPYVCTIKKSIVVKNKAKMYFSRGFTLNHIARHTQLPAEIEVYSSNTKIATVKMVMSKSQVNGKGKGGAMITTNWMEVVKKTNMRVKNVFVFWFRGSRGGGLKLLVDIL